MMIHDLAQGVFKSACIQIPLKTQSHRDVVLGTLTTLELVQRPEALLSK